MEFQSIQTSPWVVILLAAALGFIIWALVLPVRSGKVWGVVLALFMACGCLFGAMTITIQQKNQTNEAFSKQLMNEYHASSSESFSTIHGELSEYNEASIVMTRDGKDTPVFVKRVNHDDTKYTMVFTVLDEKSLYPKQ